MEEEIDIREGKGYCCCLGAGIHSIPCRTTYFHILHQDDLKKRMNRRSDTWQKGCFRKMDDPLVHTTFNHHPPKMYVLPKIVLQVMLVAKL